MAGSNLTEALMPCPFQEALDFGNGLIAHSFKRGSLFIEVDGETKFFKNQDVQELCRKFIAAFDTRPSPMVPESVPPEVIEAMTDAFISAPYIGDLKAYAKGSMQAALSAAAHLGFELRRVR